jgi:hypothetical protein
MYSINTLKIDDERLQIRVSHEYRLIGEKILELSFNENMSPTFVESGCVYSSEEFESFIKLIEMNFNSPNPNCSFSFDDQDRFDGFEVINITKGISYQDKQDVSSTQGQNYLVIKTQVEKSQTSIWILLTEETISGIVLDLKFLSKQINELIESQLKYYSILANPFPESDD